MQSIYNPVRHHVDTVVALGLFLHAYFVFKESFNKKFLSKSNTEGLL